MTPDPKPSDPKSAPVDAAQTLRDVLVRLAEIGRKAREQKLKSEVNHVH